MCLSVSCHVIIHPCLICRFPQAVLVVPLVLLDFKCCGDFLHPSGTRPLHRGCGGRLLYYYTPLLVVPHDGQPEGEHKKLIEFVGLVGLRIILWLLPSNEINLDLDLNYQRRLYNLYSSACSRGNTFHVFFCL